MAEGVLVVPPARSDCGSRIDDVSTPFSEHFPNYCYYLLQPICWYCCDAEIAEGPLPTRISEVVVVADCDSQVVEMAMFLTSMNCCCYYFCEKMMTTKWLLSGCRYRKILNLRRQRLQQRRCCWNFPWLGRDLS